MFFIVGALSYNCMGPNATFNSLLPFNVCPQVPVFKEISNTLKRMDDFSMKEMLKNQSTFIDSKEPS
jgi:hypothetical protein